MFAFAPRYASTWVQSREAHVGQRAVVLLPEVPLQHFERFAEQRLVAGRGGGQHDEDVLVGELVARLPRHREPAAVLLVPEVLAQRPQPVRGQLRLPRAGEHVRHARVDPQLARTRQVQRPVRAQPPEAAVRMHGPTREVQQPCPLFDQVHGVQPKARPRPITP